MQENAMYTSAVNSERDLGLGARPTKPSVAVLIPCYNEGAAIRNVVREFRAALPDATVYVYDNNSRDSTAEIAGLAGAVVRFEPLQGKGNVVRRMFADVEADIYVLVDGDNTYDAASAPRMIEALRIGPFDMVTGVREPETGMAFRPGHRLGNIFLSCTVSQIFGSRTSDILSGYRVLSRRFVKSFPALATGFEVETELTVHALELRMPVSEVRTPYRNRGAGSASKLRTFPDGFRIIRTLLVFVKEERPLHFFGTLFAVLAAVAVILAWPVVVTFLETGLVPRFPTAILASAMMLLAFLCLAAGLILDTVTRGRREIKRLHYLSVPAVASLPARTVSTSACERSAEG